MPIIVALNQKKKRGKKKTKKRKKMSAKQIKYFGTKAQRAALRRKRSKAAKKSSPKKKATKKVTKKSVAKKPVAKSKGRKMAKKNPKKGGGQKKQKNPVYDVTTGAFKALIPMMFGALTAKVVARKLSDGASEKENWNWKNYLWATAGTLGVSLLAGLLIRKRNITKQVFAGGLLLVGYKLVTNEIAPMNPGLESWFGESDDFNPYGALPAQNAMGDIWQRGSSDLVRGVDGRWRPANESHRRPRMLPTRRRAARAYSRGARRSMGDVLVTPDPRYGDVLVPPDQRYGDTPERMAQAMEADGM